MVLKLFMILHLAYSEDIFAFWNKKFIQFNRWYWNRYCDGSCARVSRGKFFATSLAHCFRKAGTDNALTLEFQLYAAEEVGLWGSGDLVGFYLCDLAILLIGFPLSGQQLPFLFSG